MDIGHPEKPSARMALRRALDGLQEPQVLFMWVISVLFCEYIQQISAVLAITWPYGPMAKAPDYESGDSRFESWFGHCELRRFAYRKRSFLLGALARSCCHSIWHRKLRVSCKGDELCYLLAPAWLCRNAAETGSTLRCYILQIQEKSVWTRRRRWTSTSRTLTSQVTVGMRPQERGLDSTQPTRLMERHKRSCNCPDASVHNHHNQDQEPGRLRMKASSTISASITNVKLCCACNACMLDAVPSMDRTILHLFSQV